MATVGERSFSPHWACSFGRREHVLSSPSKAAQSRLYFPCSAKQTASTRICRRLCSQRGCRSALGATVHSPLGAQPLEYTHTAMGQRAGEMGDGRHVFSIAERRGSRNAVTISFHTSACSPPSFHSCPSGVERRSFRWWRGVRRALAGRWMGDAGVGDAGVDCASDCVLPLAVLLPSGSCPSGVAGDSCPSGVATILSMSL